MSFEVLGGLLLPFLGTTLGAGCVFFMKKGMHPTVQRILTGFAAGVMVAASVWSLIIPALEQSESLEKWSFIPAVVGFWLGILMLLALDRLIPHMHMNRQCEGPHCKLQKSTMLVFAVALHNLPEGMAVGVVFAGWLAGNAEMSLAGAMILALGIAIQNFPEGAIISMPLASEGVSKKRAFVYGVLSGIVEPLGALITILAADFFTPILPYCLSLAAGAMFYVVVEELIPEMSEGEHSNIGTIAFSVGFTLMMILDVALG
ncbi:MAG: ZIP family metal transporter [Lachnospiraceae bacterium]|nr:ZIP family metal transporter [Lachnospiraceae bacterium]MEE1014439.1 ZIP family metal transporter [Lachnospiraceae bacterium]